MCILYQTVQIHAIIYDSVLVTNVVDLGLLTIVVEFGCTFEIIRASQLTGKNELSHQNIDPICNIPRLYSNLYESSSRASGQMIAFIDPKGDVIFLSKLPSAISSIHRIL